MTDIRDEDHNLIEGAGWFSVKNFAIRIHATDEGVVVDVYASGKECDDPVASTYAFDSDVEEDEGDSDVICSNCSGSGEGMYEGSHCSRCGGSGEVSTREPDDDDRADYYWQQKQDREYDLLPVETGV